MKKISFISLLLLLSILPGNAQRMMEHLDRGVVAMNKGSNKLFVSWRYFATDPEEIGFNVYRQIGTGAATKLNNTPITKSTNLVATVSGMSLADSRIFVKSVINGVEGDEEGSWDLKRTSLSHRIIRDFDFEPFPAGYPTMSMKYCWPADLNGDGKYDFVLDRQNYGTAADDAESDEEYGDFTPAHIDAYTSEGEFMWRVNAGINVLLSSGQAGMATAYDMNGDGYAEVMMAVSEGTIFPDGTKITADNGTVTDYSKTAGSAPQWVAILDGRTGNLIDKAPLPHFNDIATTRTDKWKHITGHFMIAYLDGIRPALIYEYKNRQPSGHFTGAYAAWTFEGGNLELKLSSLFQKNETQYEFHQIRVADIDGDGKDELVEGSYVIDDDGSVLYYAPNVYHGDRHCLADIDPDRPGLEHFFIQQSNIMGMGLFDAANGEMIKGLYMSSVADVGRGICGAFDPTVRGMQFYSTMGYNADRGGYAMYDRKGKLIPDSYGAYPAEPLWWGPNLSRYSINPIGSDGNPALYSFNTQSKGFVRSGNDLFRDNNGKGEYYFRMLSGGRAAFWGDLLGDWREEIILPRANQTGFGIYSTWDETDVRLYCLMQNPAYRGQTTTRGYYQTADVDYYMAADMPLPPVAPVQKADVYVTEGATLTASVANGKSVMFDIRYPSSTIVLSEDVAPSKLWLMNPKGKDYTFLSLGSGKLTGTMDIVKSMQGDVILNGTHDYTGTTRISEGRLFRNGTITGPVRIDARGVLGGNVTVDNTITLEEGLNVEGGRLEPGNGANLGNMTISGNLDFPGRNNMAFDIDQTKTDKNDKIHIAGNFTLTNTNHTIIINPVTTPQAEVLTLVTIGGTSNVTEDMFTVKGLEGIPYDLIVEPNAVKIEIKTSRSAANVIWNGAHNSGLWDLCRTENVLKDGIESMFVVDDKLAFNDNAVNKNIVINETMPVGALNFTNDTDYTISGDGIISGFGGLSKTGGGKVSLLTEENSFTGSINFADGILEVSSVKDGGLPSSIGMSSSDANNWIMRNATLKTAAPMATNRNMTVDGTLTINNPTKNTGIMLSGQVIGSKPTLVLEGEGTLNLANKTSFGNVIVKDGTLSLSSLDGNRYSLGSANVRMEGGKLIMYAITSSTSTPESNFNMEVPEGATADFTTSGRWTLKGALTGKGTLNMNIPYVRLDLNGNWSAFEGTVNVTTGYKDGVDFRINNNNSYEKATLNLGDKVGITHLTSGRTVKIGSLSGVASSKLSGGNISWDIGAKNSDMIFNGTISGDGSKLTKKGTGKLTLTGSSTYTGNTDIPSGTLVVANTEGSATGTGNVVIRTGGSLEVGTSGGGISGNVSIYTGSSLYMFDGVNNVLAVDGNLSLTNGSAMWMDIKPDQTSDFIIVGGMLTIAGTLYVPSLTKFEAGMEFKLFEAGAGKISGQFETIDATLPYGLEWDQSRLSEGIIAIIKATGINNTTVDGKTILSVEYFNLLGVRADENTKGIVIRKTIYTDGYSVAETTVNK